MTMSPDTPPPLSALDIRKAQNFPLAAASGVGAAIAGAILWAAVTVESESELGIVAVGVGAMIGYAIRKTGKGIDPKFGLLGAACGVLGCALGAVLCAVAFYAKGRGIPFPNALPLLLHPDAIAALVPAMFRPMDLLFYAIAVYEAWKLSFKYRLRKKAS